MIRHLSLTARVLACLERAPLTSAQLALRFNAPQTTITGILGALRRRGLLLREPGDGGRYRTVAPRSDGAVNASKQKT